MFSRIAIQILGVVLVLLSSAPVGVSAKENLRKARADFFALAAEQASMSEAQEGSHQQQSNRKDDALLSGDALLGEVTGEDPTNPEPAKQTKRQKRFNNSHSGRRPLAKAHFRNRLYDTAFCPASHRSQDAHQERTAIIRFLHLAADIC